MGNDPLEQARLALSDRRPVDAVAHAREALAARPGDPDVELVLGQALVQEGRAWLATMVLQRVVARRPGHSSALAALAAAHHRAGDRQEAQERWHQLVEQAPEAMWRSRALAELADYAVVAGDSQEALERAEAAVREDPGAGRALLALAHARIATGDEEGGREAASAAVARDPGMARRTADWAILLRASGDEAAAVRVLELGTRIFPDDPELAHLLAAVGGAPAPDRADPGYIEEHYDRFAAYFDWQLGTLGYEPERLVRVLDARLRAAGRPRPAAALDVGCGTGLCAAALAEIAERVVGVDLSQAMLDQAARRGVYAELHRSDLVQFAKDATERFDVVLAAEVLIYFGDLGEPLGALAGLLRPGGCLAFSTERAPDDQAVVLEASGRWAHGLGHVSDVCEALGLRLEREEAVLRHEFGAAVPGLLYVAWAPA